VKILLIVVAGCLSWLVISVNRDRFRCCRNGHCCVAQRFYTGQRLNIFFSLIAGPQDWRPDVTALRSCSVRRRSTSLMPRKHAPNGDTIAYELPGSPWPSQISKSAASPPRTCPTPAHGLTRSRPTTEWTIVQITEDGQVYNPVFRFMSRFCSWSYAHDGHFTCVHWGKRLGQEVEVKD